MLCFLFPVKSQKRGVSEPGGCVRNLFGTLKETQRRGPMGSRVECGHYIYIFKLHSCFWDTPKAEHLWVSREQRLEAKRGCQWSHSI